MTGAIFSAVFLVALFVLIGRVVIYYGRLAAGTSQRDARAEEALAREPGRSFAVSIHNDGRRYPAGVYRLDVCASAFRISSPDLGFARKVIPGWSFHSSDLPIITLDAEATTGWIRRKHAAIEISYGLPDDLHKLVIGSPRLSDIRGALAVLAVVPGRGRTEDSDAP